LPKALHPSSVHQTKRLVHDEDYLTSDVALYGLTTGRHEKDTLSRLSEQGGSMKRLVKGALLAAGTALAISAAPAMPAAAATSGTETLSGTIVFAAVPGTNTRTVISSVVLARGVFRGVGRVAERVPPDPAGVSQDDLVFRSGTMHVVSTPGTLLSPSINPHSCLFTGTQQFTWDVTGGTGQFDDATGSFTGTERAVALLARNPDGSCSLTQFPRLEVDKFAESGTLSF
jgi:hypothetical protein